MDKFGSFVRVAFLIGFLALKVGFHLNFQNKPTMMPQVTFNNSFKSLDSVKLIPSKPLLPESSHPFSGQKTWQPLSQRLKMEPNSLLNSRTAHSHVIFPRTTQSTQFTFSTDSSSKAN